MYVYKFRLLFDDIDDFARDFEILSKQTFKDFHQCIVNNIKGLNTNELASFHICDRKWNKKQEITLIDMSDDMNQINDNDDSDDTGDAEFKKPPISMEDAVISDFMDDPHQRIIYEHDFLHLKTFYIELLKSFETSSDLKYPICTYFSGEIPQNETLINHSNEVLEDETIMDMIDDNDDDDEIYYDESELNGFNSDFDTNNL